MGTRTYPLLAAPLVLALVASCTRDGSGVDPDTALDIDVLDTVGMDTTPAGDVDGDTSPLDPVDPPIDPVGDPADDAPWVDDAGDAPDGPAPWPSDRYILPVEVHDRLLAEDPDMLPLLVSDEEFWSMGMIEGSVVVPWDLLEGRLAEVDAGRHVVVYCRLGVRSESAYATLVEAGYLHVWIMTGGLTEWISLGYPVVPVP